MREVEVEADEDARLYSEGPARLLAALLGVLSLAGIGVAGYLTYVHWFDKSIVCAGFSSCAEVAQSEYARIGEVPVALLGLLGYVALAAVSAFWLRVGNRFDVWPLLAIWGMSVAGVAYSAYLTYVELFVIDAVCIWCVASAVIMTVIFLAATGGLLTLGRDSDLFAG
jgi:uncharacterized membrane protein